jgi:hypothetical protein
MEQQPIPRTLTHDEQKAAEAAFSGRPFNPSWSASARNVYDGLLRALPQRLAPEYPVEEPVVPPAAVEAIAESHPVSSDSDDTAVAGEAAADEVAVKREDAIRAGFLIDVTEAAKTVGLSFPVSVTKSLWDIGITTGQELSETERATRLRDVLMAFRLRLANHSTLSPLIDFPALLSMPVGSVPQPIPLFALVQPDEQHRAIVTLLLPNEVSTTIIPMN